MGYAMIASLVVFGAYAYSSASWAWVFPVAACGLFLWGFAARRG